MTPEQYNKEIILRLLRIERLLSLIRQEKPVGCIGECTPPQKEPETGTDLLDTHTFSDKGAYDTLSPTKKEHIIPWE